MQGQSRYTQFKQHRFAPIIAQSLRISRAASVRNFAYYHIDLHAGSGHNDQVNVEGSPLNFLREAVRLRPNFYAFFVDHNESYVQALVTRPQVEAHADRIAVFHADNGGVLDVVSAFVGDRERRPEYAVGSVLIDPNGYHKGVPWEALSEFCARHPRFDVLMNLNTRSFRMERRHILNRASGWTGYQLRPMTSFPEWFSRGNWMLTEETRLQGTSWIQLVGRSMTIAQVGYRSLGFYEMRSARGEAILAGLELGDGTDVETAGDELPLLRDVSGVPQPSGVSGGPARGDAAGELPVCALPSRAGDGGASHQVSTVGDIRRAGTPRAGLPRLPLSD